ncbi:MAG: iron-dependent repressor [Crocinitomicaceae bacterium]|nr:iron-dependent repressor [Crocinitomicaceae bacterium]|tara:strand:- start:13856 stop:14527 length:672 start_codon:yes stop_codon:yes gene_type:complete
MDALLSKNEEDYLKALFQLTIENNLGVAGTNQLAMNLGVSPASVNGMIKKLRAKKLVKSELYGKLEMTAKGKGIAIQLIRKHRLWETFLYEYLNFSWDEVHEVAEQLEHIKSDKLIKQLNGFLGNPDFDPHGDPIPDESGKFSKKTKINLAQIEEGKSCMVVSVKDASVAFLQMVSKLGIGLQTEIKVKNFHQFDASRTLVIGKKEHQVSLKFAENVFVKELD